MDKTELNEYLNQGKKKYNEIQKKDNVNKEICERIEKDMQSYVTLAGASKVFMPLDVVNVASGIALMASGEVAVGGVVAGLGVVAFIMKCLVLKAQKKNIKEAKASIAFGKFAQAVNKETTKELEKEIDRVTEIIYVDDEPEL